MKSFFRLVTTVLSAFIGIRRKSDHEAAQAQIKPVHIIVTALILVCCIIAALVTLVKTIAAHAA